MTVDRKMTLTFPSGYYDISVPEFGYKTIIDLPFEMEKLDTGLFAIYDYGVAYDKYRCEMELILDQTEQTYFNEIIATSGRAMSNITLAMPTGSGFFPFGAHKGDVGVFTIALIVNETNQIQDAPYLYYKNKITLYHTGTFPAYSLPSEVSEGQLSIGNVDNARFPEAWFAPEMELGINFAVTESNAVKFIDRSSARHSWITKAGLVWNESKTAKLIKYIVDTKRATSFPMVGKSNYSIFGLEKEGALNYTVQLVQDRIEITHADYNRFNFDLSLQYLSSI